MAKIILAWREAVIQFYREIGKKPNVKGYPRVNDERLISFENASDQEETDQGEQDDSPQDEEPVPGAGRMRSEVCPSQVVGQLGSVLVAVSRVAAHALPQILSPAFVMPGTGASAPETIWRRSSTGSEASWGRCLVNSSYRTTTRL